MKSSVKYALIGLALTHVVACQQKKDVEIPAQACLTEARIALRAENYDLAKQCIEKMRKDYPTALNAREDGILLLDSINLAEAKVELQMWIEKLQQPDLDRISQDTLDFNRDEADQKVKFFEKKISHDLANKKQW